jgi:hypothetical protein
MIRFTHYGKFELENTHSKFIFKFVSYILYYKIRKTYDKPTNDFIYLLSSLSSSLAIWHHFPGT